MSSILTPDICVVGAGASGIAVAEAARRLGASVVIVEKAEPGGSSLRSGALALRALAAAAEIARNGTRGAPFGITTDHIGVNFRLLHNHIAEVLGRSAPQSSAVRLTALGIELVRGTGSFADPRTLLVGDTSIKARRFVVATGAKPVLPDIPGLLSVPFFSTETIFDNARQPGHLAVLGAGPMGLELALSYRRLGAEVTVIESGRIFAAADPELAEIALRRLREEGVSLLEGAAIVAIQARPEGIGIVLRDGDDTRTVGVTHILVASSRSPSLEELNLQAARIRRSKADPGAVWLNASLRTSNSRVYVVGEAAGHATHLPVLEADIVVRAALLGQPTRFEPAAMTRLTLTDPEIAEIGLSEPMARARFKTGFSVLRTSYAENDRARAERNGTGVVKLVLDRAGRILGAGIVGAGAGELASLFALAIAQRLEARRLADLAVPHPSYAEMLQSLGRQAALATAPSRWQSRRLALNRLLR